MSDGVLVAGIGNIFLGDDGFGPEVVRELGRRSEPLPEHVQVVDYGIRGMHLAYDLLSGFDALVLVDTVPGEGEPGDLVTLQISPDDLDRGEFDAHGMEPAAVLSVLPSLGGELPPTYIVGCHPASLEEEMGLSQPVRDAVPKAADAVRALLRKLLSDPTSVRRT
jgi:hydrogenase maturation protease